MKNFLKTLLMNGFFTGLGTLFSTTCQATPVSSLTAGLYTFSNITCSGAGCTDITVSATTISTNGDSGVSSITFSDNGAIVPLPIDGNPNVVQYSYDVSYAGVHPHPIKFYAFDIAASDDFLGGRVAASNLTCNTVNCTVGGAPYPYSYEYGGSAIVNYPDINESASFQQFGISGDIYSYQTTGPIGPGEITTTYTAVNNPEPLSFTLFGLGLLLVAIQQVRRTRRFRPDGR